MGSKFLGNALFFMQCLSNLIFLAFAGIFFFVKDARSIGMGVIFLTIFIKLWRGDSGIPALCKDRTDFIKSMSLDDKFEINDRYCFRSKKFISKKQLAKKHEEHLKEKLRKI